MYCCSVVSLFCSSSAPIVRYNDAPATMRLKVTTRTHHLTVFVVLYSLQDEKIAQEHLEQERLELLSELAKQRGIEEKAHAARLEEIRVAEEARLNALRLQLETDRVEAEKAMAQQQRELEEQRQRLLETGRQHQQAQELAAKEAAAAELRRVQEEENTRFRLEQEHLAELAAEVARQREEEIQRQLVRDVTSSTITFQSFQYDV